jgi:type IV secretion system protein VirB4
MAFKFRPPERRISEEVRLFDHASPRVVLMKDDSAFLMFQVDGLSAQTMDEARLRQIRRSLNHDLCSLATTDGLVLYSWVCRGMASPDIYPEGPFHSRFAHGLDRRYRGKLFDRNLFLNRTYVGVMLRPPRLLGEFIGDQIEKVQSPRDIADEAPEARIHRLLRVADMIEQSLAIYSPKRLGLRRDAQGRTFSEVAEALVFAMTGVWRSVGLQGDRRIGSLFSERVITGRETIEIRGPGLSAWAACFGAQHMPETCPPGTLDGFLATPFRSTIAQSMRFIGQQTALKIMGRDQNRKVGSGDRAHSQIEALDTAMDAVQSGRMAMGDHNLVVTVFADALAGMPEVTNSAWHILQKAGAQVAREDDALEAAYFSMLPGNSHLRPRPGAVSTWNYASLAAMHAYPAGQEAGHWGGPLMMLRTTGGTPYRFHLHTNGVANTFVFGETGSGKSTLLGWLVTQCERSGIQVVLWDKDRGLEIVTRAVGGRYLSLRNPTGIAPLKALTDSDEDIHHLAQLIRGCISLPTPYEFTPEEDRRLHLGLRGIMALPPEDRWLGDLRAFLGTAPKGAGARLEKWCRGNEYGWVIDNLRDMVKLDAHVLGFDVTEFLADPMVCGPIMTHLLYRTGKLADGRRILYVVDEAWRVVQIPAFAEAAMDGLKTDRKKNAALILGSQSIRDALDSAIGYTIREQCKTVIAFGVERPDRADFRALRYTDRECEIIEGLQPATGTFLLRQGRSSVVLQLDLSGMADDIAVLSGNEVNVRHLDTVRETVDDDDPVRLIEAFHARRKAWAA